MGRAQGWNGARTGLEWGAHGAGMGPARGWNGARTRLEWGAHEAGMGAHEARMRGALG